MMASNNMEKNIKAERVRRGYTQRDLAKVLKVSPNTYNMKENGVRPFTLKEFRILLDYLDVHPNDLL